MSSAENPPVGGPIVPPATREVRIPPESPDVGARVLSVGARLLCGATIFFYLAFVFAYFYLRSLNQNHMWRPAHVHPNQGLGAAFIACVVISALLAIVAGRRMKVGSRSWLPPALIAVVLGLAAVALQCIEYTTQHWGPTNGGYASVFSGWTGFYLITVLATMYWLWTQVATEMRARRSPAGEGDVQEADRLIAPGLDAAVFYWSFLAGIGVLTWVVLYLLQ
jgi:heme/copper-type cytochrome/quinol oxidase subunit 3